MIQLLSWEMCLTVVLIVFSFLQDRKIEELKQSLLRYKKVQDMVMSVQGKKGEICQSKWCDTNVMSEMKKY